MAALSETQGFTKKPIISIAGNIGVGKTTLTKKLAELMGVPHYLESVKDNPYLAKFYEGTFTLGYQVHVITNRYLQQQHITYAGNGGVQDRTKFEERIFWRALFKQGLLSKEELEVLENISNALFQSTRLPDFIVFLDAPPEECLKRIQARITEDPSRSYESKITLEYLQSLHEAYHSVMLQVSREHFIPVIRVVWNEFIDVNALYAKIMEVYHNYVRNTSFVELDTTITTTITTPQ